MVTIDVLHALDLGTTQDWSGNLFVEAMSFLFKGTKQLYYFKSNFNNFNNLTSHFNYFKNNFNYLMTALMLQE